MPRIVRLPHAAALVLLAAGSAQATDAVTFLRMVRDLGPAAEANPLVAALARSGDLNLLLAAKVGVVALAVGVVALLAARYPVASAVVVTVAVGAGLVGATSNVLVLLQPIAS